MSALPAFIDLDCVADVLAELGGEIERLGAALCSNPAIAASHIDELQSIDHIAQQQRALASLLRAECPATALAELGLEVLKQRFVAPTWGNEVQ